MLELTEGTTFAGYQIEKVAGHGGMGVVYRARHLRLDRVDALKLIAPDLAGDVGFRARFERESRVAAGIDHPHVITIYHAGEEGGQLYLAMKFIEGTDLRAEISKCGQLEPGRAVGILAQVASALDAAHRSGLVHRDVKPANVLLAKQDGGDYAYLTDFGLTKQLQSRGKDTRTGMFVGTVDYIAPEQARGGGVDARADVYSLGCVLYHLLTGQVPYPREDPVATIMAQVEEQPPSLQELRPELAQRFDPVIHKAMAKDAGDRYESAGDLASAAQAVFEGKTVPSPQGSVATGEAAPTKTQIPVPPPPPTWPPGWYREPRTGQQRWWTRTEWGPAATPGAVAVGVPPPPGWYREPGTERLRRWTGSEWGEYKRPDDGGGGRNRRWVRSVLAATALVAGIVIAVVLATSGGPSTTTPPPPPKPPVTTASPSYLSALMPTQGDTPSRGDIQLGGADFPNSIFYEDVASAQSTASACQNSLADCRDTFYELGGRYKTFTASFGLTQGGNPAFTAQGNWAVSVGGQVIKQGTVPANSAPEPIDVSVSGGQVLELRTIVHEAIGDTSTAVWGNAHIG